MAWTVLIGDEFEPEFLGLLADVQDHILAVARLLQQFGPQLGRPHVDTLKGSRHANMKEMRVYAADGAWRAAFAFDPIRNAIVLVAGDKSGGSEKRFYRELIRAADERFDAHLARLSNVGREKQMARNIDDIIDKLPAARRRRIEKRAAALVAEEMTLQELRRARAMTQVEMAKNLGIAQKQISEIEKRTDMHISTLRRSVEALGGKLSLVAEFPDRDPVVLAGITALDA